MSHNSAKTITYISSSLTEFQTRFLGHAVQKLVQSYIYKECPKFNKVIYISTKNNILNYQNLTSNTFLLILLGGGLVERRCWVNFQCRGVLLVWIIVGQGPIALAVGAGGGCLDIFSLIYLFSILSPSLWQTARYRLKYCLKGPKTTNQPT